MSWERSVVGVLARGQTTSADVFMAPGYQYNAGTSSVLATGHNILGGDRIWDKCAVFLKLDGVITGTWTVEVQGTVAGINRLPLARVAGLTVARVSGLLAGTSSIQYGTSCIQLTNMNGLQAMLSPSGILFDNTSAGGITADVVVVAKTNRGSLPKGTLNRSRVHEGLMFGIPAPAAGQFTVDGALGITTSRIVTLSNNPTKPTGATAWGELGGLDAVQIWDTQMYWMDVVGISGVKWNVAVQGLVPGSATHFVTIAGLDGVSGVTKIAFTTFGNAGTIKPNRVVFDFADANGIGVSAWIAGSIVYAAKTSRGQRHLR